jgi:allophanate hydrolase subunit 1
MQHDFQFPAPLAFADVERLTGALCTLPGVRGIDLVPGGRRMQVEFDESATSTQAITAALAGAGYRADRADRAERSGCCGGCCGG